jgi:outer membrane protein TolC
VIDATPLLRAAAARRLAALARMDAVMAAYLPRGRPGYTWSRQRSFGG